MQFLLFILNIIWTNFEFIILNFLRILYLKIVKLRCQSSLRLLKIILWNVLSGFRLFRLVWIWMFENDLVAQLVGKLTPCIRRLGLLLPQQLPLSPRSSHSSARTLQGILRVIILPLIRGCRLACLILIQLLIGDFEGVKVGHEILSVILLLI